MIILMSSNCVMAISDLPGAMFSPGASSMAGICQRRCERLMMTLAASEQHRASLSACCFYLSGWINYRVLHSILYSDGVTEAKRADGNMLERQDLVCLLQQHQDKASRDRLRAIVKMIGSPHQVHDDFPMQMMKGEQD